MKRSIYSFILALGFLSMSSCATLLGGPISEHQTRRPKPGEQQREIRVIALIADLLLFAPGTIVDFATGAIYKPKEPRTILEIKIN